MGFEPTPIEAKISKAHALTSEASRPRRFHAVFGHEKIGLFYINKFMILKSQNVLTFCPKMGQILSPKTERLKSE